MTAPRFDLAKLDRMEGHVAGLQGQRQAAAETIKFERANQRVIGGDMATRVKAINPEDLGHPAEWLKHSDELLSAVNVRRTDIVRLIQDQERVTALEARITELDREIQAHNGAVTACRKFINAQTEVRFF